LGRKPYPKVILRLTRDEGRDPIDGSEMNAVRRAAIESLNRTEDDLTDRELFAQQADDDWWYVELCLETLHRLPTEVDPLLLCRQYTELQAYHIVKRAMTGLIKAFEGS